MVDLAFEVPLEVSVVRVKRGGFDGQGATGRTYSRNLRSRLEWTAERCTFLEVQMPRSYRLSGAWTDAHET